MKRDDDREEKTKKKEEKTCTREPPYIFPINIYQREQEKRGRGWALKRREVLQSDGCCAASFCRNCSWTLNCLFSSFRLSIVSL